MFDKAGNERGKREGETGRSRDRDRRVMSDGISEHVQGFLKIIFY